MNKSKHRNALPQGAIRQQKGLSVAAGFAMFLGALLALAGVGSLLPNQAPTAAPTSLGQGIAFIVLGAGMLAFGIWAMLYYRNNYIVLLPMEIMQRTASRRIKRIPYSSVVNIEEFVIRWSPAVRITGIDGTVIRADALKLDVAGIKAEVARYR